MTGERSDPRAEVLDAAMRRHQLRGDALVVILHVAQEAHGWLPPEVLGHVARLPAPRERARTLAFPAFPAFDRE